MRAQKLGSKEVSGLSDHQIGVVNRYLAEAHGPPPRAPLRFWIDGEWVEVPPPEDEPLARASGVSAAPSTAAEPPVPIFLDENAARHLSERTQTQAPRPPATEAASAGLHVDPEPNPPIPQSVRPPPKVDRTTQADGVQEVSLTAQPPDSSERAQQTRRPAASEAVAEVASPVPDADAEPNLPSLRSVGVPPAEDEPLARADGVQVVPLTSQPPRHSSERAQAQAPRSAAPEAVAEAASIGADADPEPNLPIRQSIESPPLEKEPVARTDGVRAVPLTAQPPRRSSELAEAQVPRPAAPEAVAETARAVPDADPEPNLPIRQTVGVPPPEEKPVVEGDGARAVPLTAKPAGQSSERAQTQAGPPAASEAAAEAASAGPDADPELNLPIYQWIVPGADVRDVTVPGWPRSLLPENRKQATSRAA